MPIERLGRRRGMHESVRTGNTVYISGQVATDENGEIVGKDDIEAQIEQVYKNLERHCRANGGTLRNIVKTTTYVSDGAYRAAIGKCERRSTVMTPLPAPRWSSPSLAPTASSRSRPSPISSSERPEQPWKTATVVGKPDPCDSTVQGGDRLGYAAALIQTVEAAARR